MEFESNSPEETFEFGKEMGKKAKPGDIITLSGDLGVGKTVFAQGFAEGLDIIEPINSPTFTIIQVYEGGRLPLYHFDVYRIADPEEMYEIGFEEYFFGEGVCLVEWANLISELLPENITKVEIKKSLTKGFDFRKIVVEKEGKEIDTSNR